MATIVLYLLAALGAAGAGLVAYAVWAEPGPLTGAALASSPAAKTYRAREAAALAALATGAKTFELDLASPAMHVHGFERGQGAPVVLLHGGGSSAAQWIPLLGELGPRHLYAVDRPGCGLSDGIDYTDVDLRRHAVAFVGALLDALHLERAVLVGNSMGGLWSIWYALEHPERVSGLVLLGTPAGLLGTSAPRPMRMMSVPGLGQLMGLKTPDEATQRERMAGAVGRHAMDRVPQDLFELARSGQRIPGAGRSYRTLNRRILDRSGVRPGVTPAAGELARLSPPSLWVWGDADVFADAGFPGRLRAALPSQDLVVMPGAGHLPWLDDAAAVGRSVRTFLERLEGSARPPG